MATSMYAFLFTYSNQRVKQSTTHEQKNPKHSPTGFSVSDACRAKTPMAIRAKRNMEMRKAPHTSVPRWCSTPTQ